MYRFIHLDNLANLYIFSGISAVVVTRTFLFLTGYPQIGSSSGLHIAHVLFGGLLMMIATMMLFIFIPLRRLLYFAAVIGGVGFGLFIDEVGKFVTQDVDYFFKPAFVIMYVVFVLMFIVYRLLQRRAITQDEYFLNSVELLKEAMTQQMDKNEHWQALTYLEKCQKEPLLTAPLTTYFGQVNPPAETPSRKDRFTMKMQITMGKSWFNWALFAFFIIEAVLLLLITVLYAMGDGFVNLVESVVIITETLRGLLILVGIVFARKSHRLMYSLFWYATILSITIVELYRLYDDPVNALIWLIIDGILLLSLQYLKKNVSAPERETPVDTIASALEMGD